MKCERCKEEKDSVDIRISEFRKSINLDPRHWTEQKCHECREDDKRERASLEFGNL